MQQATALLEQSLHVLRLPRDDRSCWSCDMLVIGEKRCMHWNSPVPADAVDKGCEEFRSSCVPF